MLLGGWHRDAACMHALEYSCGRNLNGCGCRACRQGIAPGGRPGYVNPTRAGRNGCRKKQPLSCGMLGLVDGAVGSLRRRVCVLDVTRMRRRSYGAWLSDGCEESPNLMWWVLPAGTPSVLCRWPTISLQASQVKINISIVRRHPSGEERACLGVAWFSCLVLVEGASGVVHVLLIGNIS